MYNYLENVKKKNLIKNHNDSICVCVCVYVDETWFLFILFKVWNLLFRNKTKPNQTKRIKYNPTIGEKIL